MKYSKETLQEIKKIAEILHGLGEEAGIFLAVHDNHLNDVYSESDIEDATDDFIRAIKALPKAF